METRNISTIRYTDNGDQTVIDMANYLGKIIVPGFEVSKQRLEKQTQNVKVEEFSMRESNPYGKSNKTTKYDITGYTFVYPNT